MKNITYVEKRKVIKPGSLLKNERLPGWTKNNVIHLFTQRKGPTLV